MGKLNNLFFTPRSIISAVKWTSRLTQIIAFLPNSLLQANELTNHYGLMKTLPVNYRPPSRHGIAIPTTENIYNADPGQRMYKSKYQVIYPYINEDSVLANHSSDNDQFI